MSWQIKLAEDKSVLLDDLTGDDFFAACKGHDDVSWLRLYVAPATHPGALYDLICLVAKRLGVEPPCEKPENITDSIALLQYLEQVEDDLPAAFDEHGSPLVTGEADETTTGTSSTSTTPEDGIQVEPEELP